MTETEVNTEIFLERTYDFRSWRFYFFILAFVGMGGIALIGLTSDAARDRPFGQYALLVALLGGLAGTMVVFGLVFLLRAIRGVKVTVRIDANGITEGRKLWKWEQIRWIGPEIAEEKRIAFWTVGRPKYNLSFVRRGGFFPRQLWVGKTLSEEEYGGLISRLGQYLTENHPQVAFGPRRNLWKSWKSE